MIANILDKDDTFPFAAMACKYQEALEVLAVLVEITEYL